jgi:protein-disulfide isomerase
LAAAGVKARIERDIETGIESGVDGTPSLFIGGRHHLGPRDAEDLGLALDPQGIARVLQAPAGRRT